MAGSELYAPLYYSTARPIALAAPQRCRRLTSGGRRRKGWLGARQSVSRHRPTARRALRQAAEHAAHSLRGPPSARGRQRTPPASPLNRSMLCKFHPFTPYLHIFSRQLA